MAEMAAKIVSQYFENKQCSPKETSENGLTLGWEFKGGAVMIHFHFSDDDAHVSVLGYGFVNGITESKRDVLYKVMNDCNAKYSHIKFYLDPEGDQMFVRDEDVIQLDTCGPECFELMLRMVKCVEDAYPTIMKALWA